MSAGDAYVATVSGIFDRFDIAAGVADWVARMVRDAELPVEFHVSAGTTKVNPHFYDREQDYLDRLEEARDLVFQACRICQEILAELP